MGLALALAACGLIPTDCVEYGVVWDMLMPAGAACFLLESDLTQLVHSGGLTLASFLLGMVGMILGAVIGLGLLRGVLGPDALQGGRMAACLCASYVGGSTNFAAVAKASITIPLHGKSRF